MSLLSTLDETCVSLSPKVFSMSHSENFNHLSYPQGNQRKDVSFSWGENFKEVMSLFRRSSAVAVVTVS